MVKKNTRRLPALFALVFCVLWNHGAAATFPAPNAAAARLEIADTDGSLSWNPASVSPAPNALTVMFWAKIVIPDVSAFQLTEDMTLLGNRRTGDWSQAHAYRFYFSAASGNLEFTAKGAAGALPPVTLIARPYLDRWYHLAAVRSGAAWEFFVDGRRVSSPALPDIGNMGTTDGVSVGGLLTAQRFYGEIQEFALIQRRLTAADIQTNRLRDIPAAFTGLRGYYKLGFAPALADSLKNYAAAPPAPLAAVPAATSVGSGTVDFPETDKQGEQSLFDSQKNQGRDAQSPLSGSFSWQRTLFTRPTAGVPFEFRIGFSSGIAFNSQALEAGTDMFSSEAVLGPGWRHSFQTRIIPGQQFLATGSSYLGLLAWDGSLETWQRSTGRNYKTLHSEYRGELQESPDGDAIYWISPERLIYQFYHPNNEPDVNLVGKLKSIRDFYGNTVSLTYEPSQGLLDTVTDTAGTIWQFAYNAQSRLSTVKALGWTATFTYDAESRLQTFSHRGPEAYETTPPLSTTWTMAYGGNGAAPGVLSSVSTPRGTTDIQVGYDKYGRKTVETDGSGRSSTYAYLTPGPRQITRTDGDGKKWIETFDRKGHLIVKTDPLGNSFRYEFYNLGDPMPALGAAGIAPVAGVLKRMTEPLGWVTTFDAYDERANLLQRTDALGYVWKWTYARAADPAGANGKLTELLPGGSTAAPVTALLNRPLKDVRPRSAGETADWENRFFYNAQGSLLRHEDDIGTLAAYGYDARGLVTSSRDANLSETASAYFPGTGFLHTRTVAAGTPYQATTTFAVTELGWVHSASNALGESVSMGFDINGNTVRTTDALGRTLLATYDPLGNLLSSTDAAGAVTRHAYDSSNLRISSTDRVGSTANTAYNARSLPSSVTTPQVAVYQPGGPPAVQNLSTLRAYDEAGRLWKTTDPAGQISEHRYDANGNQIETVDRLGRVWRKQYDRLNRLAVEIDPLGNVRTTTYDEAGRLSTITSANGFTTRHEYDGRGRLRKWTDPTGAVWTYSYDGVGNILDIQDALGGHYLMSYDARNLRLSERNQDGLIWTYSYDLLGRLKSQYEPSGIVRTLLYDPAGRVECVNFSTGRENRFDYDAKNNIVQLRRIDPDGTVTRTLIAYDVLDRPVSSTDTFGQTVGYGYDALSRVTSLIYPGNRILSQEFDVLSRLRRQTTGANWGPLELTYDWDKEGRLTAQKYPNGIVRNAAWDEAGRQKSLSYTDSKGTPDTADDAVQIALTYAYDKNGNLTDSREKGLFVPPVSAPHDVTSAYTPGGRLTSRTDAVDASGQKDWSYEFKNADGSPSFNLSKAICPSVGSLSLAYDEDNRTTSLQFTSAAPGGGNATTLKNRYDVLGRRISRNAVTAIPGGTEAHLHTRYVLSLIGGMERILADADGNGQLTALYIHGPDLAVKIDPADPTRYHCYHADSSGNIIRITDQAKAPVVEYAYSDYGEQLGSTATPFVGDPNPYRFVGSQGVMAEGLIPGLYFMRARYYLANAGVFLSTDPVKNIGPGWKPEAYGYANGNPIHFGDADGNIPYLLARTLVSSIVGGTIGAIGETLNQTISWATDGNFDGGQILHKSAEGIVSGAISGLTGNSIAGSAAGEVYGDYIKALEKGEDYDIGSALASTVKGSIKGKVFDSLPKFGNKGKVYSGGVPGALPTTLSGGFSGSHFRNSLPQEVWNISRTVTTTIANNVSQLLNRSNSTVSVQPSGFPSSVSAGGGVSSNYTIRPGDTLSAIAARNGTTVGAIAAANGISNPNFIRSGAVITIPSRGSVTGGASGGSSSSGSRPGSSGNNSVGDFPRLNANIG